MFETSVEPHFCDTDALGHISNTVLPVWFEGARAPLFRLVMPEMDLANWKLILRKVEVEFDAELFWGQTVTIKTRVGTIGNTSFQVLQEAWQGGKCCARGCVTLIYFDFETRQTVPIPDSLRADLAAHQA